ncbi:hypothetical protein GP475_08830 [Corynebacterium poyangense]|uniref:Uncharacterized protein n=1 Tax=Corynebacterium poyangense TaxID=2684405 RepID=A0A7H0SQA6_9CORY|nr:toxin HicA [Corynebacterium poyangense]QNQ90731.1 hypothetical protein GP475_08830 [Corynebacterium poyangense]
MAKRNDILKEIRKYAKKHGLHLEMREGANHTLIRLGNRRSVIGRHTEINEITAREIRKQLGIRRK